MKTIDPIKLSIAVGITSVILPLTGFPQSFKTVIIMLFGASLLYVSLMALHYEKHKKLPTKRMAHRRPQTFVESRPQQNAVVPQDISSEIIPPQENV